MTTECIVSQAALIPKVDSSAAYLRISYSDLLLALHRGFNANSMHIGG